MNTEQSSFHEKIITIKLLRLATEPSLDCIWNYSVKSLATQYYTTYNDSKLWIVRNRHLRSVVGPKVRRPIGKRPIMFSAHWTQRCRANGLGWRYESCLVANHPHSHVWCERSRSTGYRDRMVSNFTTSDTHFVGKLSSTACETDIQFQFLISKSQIPWYQETHFFISRNVFLAINKSGIRFKPSCAIYRAQILANLTARLLDNIVYQLFGGRFCSSASHIADCVFVSCQNDHAENGLKKLTMPIRDSRLPAP